MLFFSLGKDRDWWDVGEGYLILYYLIISYFILYRIDNGNCYIGRRMK